MSYFRQFKNLKQGILKLDTIFLQQIVSGMITLCINKPIFIHEKLITPSSRHFF